MVNISISLYFGLPGSGKSTLMAKFALKATRKGSPYKNVYVNFPVAVDGVKKISWDDIGKYNLHDGLILLDEASVGSISNRAYGNKGKKADNDRIIEWFMMHRHARTDVILFFYFIFTTMGWCRCFNQKRFIRPCISHI